MVVTAAELVACTADDEDDAADEAGAEVVTGAALVGVVVGVAVDAAVGVDDAAGDWLLVGAPLVGVVLGEPLVVDPLVLASPEVDVAAEVESLGDGAVGTLVGGATAGTSSAAVSGTV